MLLFICVLTLAAVAHGQVSSCIPSVTTVPVPSSVESVLISAEVYVPSLTTVGSIISTFELSSPTLASIETVIESYEHSYSSIVSEIESMYSYSSLYTDETITELTTAYSTLAQAISGLESIEETQTELAAYQQTLQSLEILYSTILSVLSLYTDIEYPSIYSASQVISQATLTDSSIFGTVIAVSTAVESSPSISSAVEYLSSAAYTLPSLVVSEIITYIYSPSTVGSSTISSLESCYSSVLSAISVVTAFTYSSPSIVSDLTAYISAASIVSSLGSAVSTIVSDEMPTLSYEVSVLTNAASVSPYVSLDLSVLTGVFATSPSLLYAESTIEGSFYASPSVAYTIWNALEYPSLVTDPTVVSCYEESHESFVTAVDDFLSWEAYYTSSATLVGSIETQLTSLFESYGTLLTAYTYVQDVTSPSVASATAAISSAKTVVSDLTYVLSSIVSILSVDTSLSCAESEIEQYATEYPSIVIDLWSDIDGYSYVATSSVSVVQSLEASYTLLASALLSVYYDAICSTNPFPFTLESSFISAAYSDSSLITQFESLSTDTQAAYTYLITASFTDVCSYAS